MCTQVIDMMHGIAYLLIPGFLILSLLFFRNFNMGWPEKIKADHYWLPRGRKY